MQLAAQRSHRAAGEMRDVGAVQPNRSGGRLERRRCTSRSSTCRSPTRRRARASRPASRTRRRYRVHERASVRDPPPTRKCLTRSTTSRAADAVLHQRTIFGSNTSRRPSPSRLNASAARTIASPGEDREPRRLGQERLRALQHHAPRRRRRSHAQPEERERRLSDDRAGNDDRGLNEQRPAHVREDVPEDDRAVAGAVRDRRGNEVGLAQRERLAARDPDQPRNRRDAERECRVFSEGPRIAARRDREDQERECEEHVGCARDHRVEPAAVVAGDEAERHARSASRASSTGSRPASRLALPRRAGRRRHDRNRPSRAGAAPTDGRARRRSPRRSGHRGDERRERGGRDEDEDHDQADDRDRPGQEALSQHTPPPGARIRQRDVDGAHACPPAILIRGSRSEYRTSTARLTIT